MNDTNPEHVIDRLVQADPEGGDELPEPEVTWEGPPECQAKLVTAIAAAMLDFGPVKRDARGQIGNRYFEYAPMANLTGATRVALAKQGVIVMQPLSHSKSAGKHCLTTIVAGHGARMISRLDFEPAKLPNAGGDRDSPQVADLKEYGKQTTYLRRYTYQSEFCLDGEPDADEAGEAAPEPARRQEPRREPPKPEPRARQPEPPRQPPRPEPRQEIPPPAPVPREVETRRTDPPKTNAAEPPPREDGDPGPGAVREGTDRVVDRIEAPRAQPSAQMPGRVERAPEPAKTPSVIPAAIDAMSDEQLSTALREAAVKLGMNRIALSRECVAVVGKSLDEARHDRPSMERLLAALQSRAA